MGATALGNGVAGPGQAKSCLPAGWNVDARPCDCCFASASVLFCRADAAFMCLACDARLHGAAAVGHERVWMCDVCERAPAAVTCKADAAALCATCDRDIHSANPLARRHERTPVVPFHDASAAAAALLLPPAVNEELETLIHDSWISGDPNITGKLPPADDLENVKPEFSFPDSDQFLDFDNYQIYSPQPYKDSLVPVRTAMNAPPEPEIDFTSSNIINLYSNSFTTSSVTHSVSSSSLDVGIVPDSGGGASDSFPRSMSSIDLTASHGSPAVGMDREARVLRYKEKRKNRKFEKTIRYASRKAYAETRPRIKGRFAKRTDSEPDIYGFFGPGAGGDLVGDGRYGIVPTF